MALLGIGAFFRLGGLQEGEVDLVAFGALVKVVADLREARGRILSGDLEVHEARQEIEEFPAKNLRLLHGKDGFDQIFEGFLFHDSSAPPRYL